MLYVSEKLLLLLFILLRIFKLRRWEKALVYLWNKGRDFYN